MSGMFDRPVVGVTGPNRGGYAAWLMTSLALRRAGAKPVRITPRLNVDKQQLQAVVVGGGSDVEPSHYGEDPEPLLKKKASRIKWLDYGVNFLLFLLRLMFAVKKKQRYDPERDSLEKDIIQYALDQQLPILGICRGAQLLNIVLGGSLYQDIDAFYDETPYIKSLLPLKSVTIEPDSLLSNILQSNNSVINALHHQAIKVTGDQVKVSARDSAGVVQGIEMVTRPFVVGVQWHPEYLPQLPQHQGLFKALVKQTLQQSQKQASSGQQ